MRATTSGNINILGINAAATKDELYSIQARLITRQSLATVVENESSIPVLESEAFRPRFRKLIQGRPTATDFFLIDGISVYFITVERYRKADFSLGGMFASFGGGASYKKDENFNGARILVTGDTVPIVIEMFPPDKPSLPPSPTPFLATSEFLNTLSASKAADLSKQLKAKAIQ